MSQRFDRLHRNLVSSVPGDDRILLPEHAKGKPLEILFRPMVGMQEEMLSCPADMILLGGARGGGKTQVCLRGDWMYHMAMLGSRARGLVVRDKQKYAHTARKELEKYYARFGGYWRAQDPGQFIFPNGAVQMWGYIDKTEDAENWKGQNLTWILVEEATLIRSQDAVLRMLALLRGDVPEKRFLLTTNPEGPGLMWVKSLFIDDVQSTRERKGGAYGQATTNMGRRLVKTRLTMPDGTIKHVSRIFLPATAHDNYILNERDPNYEGLLHFSTHGDESLQQAWVHGDWTGFSEQYFDNWNKWKEHGGLCPTFDIPPSWPRWIGFDAGFRTPFCFLWAAGVPHDLRVCERDADGRIVHEQVIPRDSMVIYREWYGVKHHESGRPMPNKGLRYTSEVLGKVMAMKREKDPDPIAGYADPASWRMSSRMGPSLMDQIAHFEEEYWRERNSQRRPVHWIGANNTRVGGDGFVGWDAVRQRMEPSGPHGRPYLYVMLERCPNIERTVPYLERDPDKPEDLRKGGEDHCADVLRYLCAMIPFDTVMHDHLQPVDPWEKDAVTFADIIDEHNRATGESIPNRARTAPDPYLTGAPGPASVMATAQQTPWGKG